MEAQKDIFGQYLPYQSPVITGYEEFLEALLNTMADGIISELGDEGFLSIIGRTDRQAVIQYCVGFVNMNIGGIELERVDGNSIKSLVNKVLDEKILELTPEPEEE